MFERAQGKAGEVRQTVKGVLFDLDNTLIDRDRVFLAWAHWFVRDRLGLCDDLSASETIELIVALDAGGYGPKEAMFRSLKDRYPCLAEEAAELVVAFREQLREHIVEVDECASKFLNALERIGLPWGIVTNGSSSQLLKVRKIGLDTRTGRVVVSEMLGVRKPSPEIFRAAADRLGVDPPDILFVGDNPQADIAGAAKVGMQTAWLRRGREWPTHLAAVAPHHTIDSLTELLWVAKAS